MDSDIGREQERDEFMRIPSLVIFSRYNRKQEVVTLQVAARWQKLISYIPMETNLIHPDIHPDIHPCSSHMGMGQNPGT